MEIYMKQNKSNEKPAHYFTASNGATCVSLSATSDPAYSNDVTDVQLTANNIEVQGFPR